MVLTPAERRALLLVVGLLALGTLWDLAGVRSAARRRDHADAEQRRRARGAAPDGAAEARLDSAFRAPRDSGRLDLNRATVAELDALPGVGPVLARRIIDHRERYGGFRDPRDLRAVKGIGPKLYARLQPLVEARMSPP